MTGRWLRRWAVLWTALLVPVFLGVSVLTIALWATDPDYTTSTPVSDLSFLALGAMIALGFASQLRRHGPRLAGAWQAVLAAAALAVAGALGNRVEPLVGGLALVLAALVLVALSPSRRGALGDLRRPDRTSTLLVLVVVVPVAVYSAHLIALARDAGPSCFLGECAYGDRFAEMAATSGAIVALGALSARRPPGWRLPGGSSAAAAIVLGVSSLALPGAPGALGTVWAALALVWGSAFLAVTLRRPAGTGGPG